MEMVTAIWFIMAGFFCILISFAFEGTAKNVWMFLGIGIIAITMLMPLFLPSAKVNRTPEDKPSHVVGIPRERFLKK
jgi:hypothetical protein